MRRADYMLVARGFSESRPRPGQRDDWYDGWADAVMSMANVLEEDNPVFDRAQFLRNCNYDGSVQ